MNANAAAGRPGNVVRVVGWSFAAGLMLLPLIAMQYSDEVDWTPGDFVFAGVMIGGSGLLIELLVRRARNGWYRGGAIVALATAFLTIWVNGAVGIIGDEGDPANLMFGGVLAVALLGAIVARFRAPGMARAMFAASLVQVLVGVVAYGFDLGAGEPGWPMDVIGGTGFLTLAWAFAGGLFIAAAPGRTHKI